MGFWDKLKGRVRDELAERAAKAALEKSTAAAKGAMRSAGQKIERALFGDGDGDGARSTSDTKRRDDEERTDGRAEPIEPKAHDAQAFFAEARKKEREAAEARAAARAEERARIEREVDDEIEALKKKLGKE